ncbi:MAG: transcriptional repressor [Cyclobacteriaceae bacterium]|nr:transcriptional repressor [Cyclobacteriaceae bacterium]
MKFSDYKKLLKTHELRVTDCRIDVLDKFHHSSYAMSFKDLEEDLAEYDRVTLYRTLHSFIDKGLLHRIPGDEGFASYALCPQECGNHGHHHDHVHFKCKLCGHIECLPDFSIPKVEVPEYEINEQSLVLNGVCKICKKSIP